jgi:molecular chaperone HtpG
MNDRALVKTAVTARPVTVRSIDSDWAPGPERVIIGKDVLELLSTSMYIDPMSIYREYIQNAADAIDEARASKILRAKDIGKVTINLDASSRSIRIRDNGAGLSWGSFAERICNLGASIKRGTAARGFRGVGRLAGLGYCQELVFRSRSPGEGKVSELRWDCRRLKSTFRSAELNGELSELVREVVSVRRILANDLPERFFEVELNGVIRHRNDRLLSPQAVGEYLSQVAPVPFAPNFRFGGDVSAALRPHVALGELDIRVNDLDRPIYRPHRNRIEIDDGEYDKYTDLELREIPGIDGDVAAVVWVLHHSYSGAIPNSALVKGLRLRSGNMQVGDHALLEELFPEPRFNAWSVGEIHVVDSRVIPNGRRDHFEHNVHFDNLLNHLGPTTRDIARRCRQSSISRKWLREFELHKAAAIERAEVVARGGLSKAARKTHAEAAAKCLAAMEKIANQRHLAEETRATLASQAAATTARVTKLLAGEPRATDPLAHFRPQVRTAYEHVIGLIYDCASNRAAAKSLVDKILTKLEVGEVKIDKISCSPKSRRRK